MIIYQKKPKQTRRWCQRREQTPALGWCHEPGGCPSALCDLSRGIFPKQVKFSESEAEGFKHLGNMQMNISAVSYPRYVIFFILIHGSFL